MSTPTINGKNGSVNVHGVMLMGGMSLADLGSLDANRYFSVGRENNVLFKTQRIPCIFADTECADDVPSFRVSLRFEFKQLTSVFITITDPAIPMDTEAEFYQSITPRIKLHETWLKFQLGVLSSCNLDYSWGSAGVAQDKSDEVYVYLHYA